MIGMGWFDFFENIIKLTPYTFYWGNLCIKYMADIEVMCVLLFSRYSKIDSLYIYLYI